MAQPTMSKKVAIIGSGCSGIAAFWALSNGSSHDVVLYEADSRLGGHTNTVPWKSGKYTVDVDTGFIVLNTATYPNFINFLKAVNVSTQQTNMALSVSKDGGSFEWSGKGLNSVFCQATNVFHLRFWRMLFDVIRFHQLALDVLIDAENGTASLYRDMTIGDYLQQYGYSDSFRDGFLIPLTAAVWSTSPDQCARDFPILTLIRFLWNHHELSTMSARPDWLTLKDGSRSYIQAVMKGIPPDRVHINTPVQRLENNADGRVTLKFEGGQAETFDHVILATHGDDALSILGSSATADERSVLSCFKTSANEVVLHSDTSHMPKRRAAWASWNYITRSPQPGAMSDTVSITYNMNTLQHIPEDVFGPILVTLNPLQPPDPALTQARFAYSHPLYTANAIDAQSRLPRIQNTRNISYAGAWTRYGFHEDGFSSGLQVAQDHLGAVLPFTLQDSSRSRGRKPELGMMDYVLRIAIFLIQTLIVRPVERVAGLDRPYASKMAAKKSK